ncbi:hypothetical protein MP228_009530 [Amoeboaphelidium protococcarum]|nr:hypothetical protein MP228_009530 [Amoeboaphelidium protococcarum]
MDLFKQQHIDNLNTALQQSSTDLHKVFELDATCSIVRCSARNGDLMSTAFGVDNFHLIFSSQSQMNYLQGKQRTRILDVDLNIQSSVNLKPIQMPGANCVPVSVHVARYFCSLVSVAFQNGSLAISERDTHCVLVLCQFENGTTGYYGIQVANGQVHLIDSVSRSRSTVQAGIPFLDVTARDSCRVNCDYNLMNNDYLSQSDSQNQINVCLSYALNQVGSEFSLNKLPQKFEASLNVKLCPMSFDGSFQLQQIKCQYLALVNLNKIRNADQGVDLWTGLRNKVSASMQVDNFLESYVQGRAVEYFQQLQQHDIDDQEDVLDSDLDQKMFRQDQDFCDFLWTFCQQTVNQTDYVQVMNAIADSLESGTLLPALRKNNDTQLSQLISESNYLHSDRHIVDLQEKQSNISSQFDYWLQEPSEDVEVSPSLQLLIEIGYNKLWADLQHIFIAQKLLSQYELNQFFNTSSLTEKINKLGLLLVLSQLLYLLKSNLFGLGADNIRVIVQNAFSCLVKAVKSNSNLNDLTYQFSYTLPKYSAGTVNCMSALCSTMHPEMVNLTYESKFSTKRLLFMNKSIHGCFRNGGLACGQNYQCKNDEDLMDDSIDLESDINSVDAQDDINNALYNVEDITIDK